MTTWSFLEISSEMIVLDPTRCDIVQVLPMVNYARWTTQYSTETLSTFVTGVILNTLFYLLVCQKVCRKMLTLDILTFIALNSSQVYDLLLGKFHSNYYPNYDRSGDKK